MHDITQCPGFPSQGGGCLAEHIDKAGCDCKTPRVEFQTAPGARKIADTRNRVAVNRNISDKRRFARAVINCAASHDNIIDVVRMRGREKHHDEHGERYCRYFIICQG